MACWACGCGWWVPVGGGCDVVLASGVVGGDALAARASLRCVQRLRRPVNMCRRDQISAGKKTRKGLNSC